MFNKRFKFLLLYLIWYFERTKSILLKIIVSYICPVFLNLSSVFPCNFYVKNKLENRPPKIPTSNLLLETLLNVCIYYPIDIYRITRLTVVVSVLMLFIKDDVMEWSMVKKKKLTIHWERCPSIHDNLFIVVDNINSILRHCARSCGIDDTNFRIKEKKNLLFPSCNSFSNHFLNFFFLLHVSRTDGGGILMCIEKCRENVQRWYPPGFYIICP